MQGQHTTPLTIGQPAYSHRLPSRRGNMPFHTQDVSHAYQNTATTADGFVAGTSPQDTEMVDAVGVRLAAARHTTHPSLIVPPPTQSSYSGEPRPMNGPITSGHYFSQNDVNLDHTASSTRTPYSTRQHNAYIHGHQAAAAVGQPSGTPSGYHVILQPTSPTNVMTPASHMTNTEAFTDPNALLANSAAASGQHVLYSSVPSGAAAMLAAAVANGNLRNVRLSLPAMMIPPPSPNIYPFLTIADDNWRRDANWTGVASPRQQYYEPVRPHTALPQPIHPALHQDYASLMREYGQDENAMVGHAAQHNYMTPSPHMAIYQSYAPAASVNGLSSHQYALTSPHTPGRVALQHHPAMRSHLPNVVNGHWQQPLGYAPRPLQMAPTPTTPSCAPTISAPIPGLSDLNLQNISSEVVRDQLLSQAHSMYATKPRDENILRLLHLIHSYHPDHLPTMLLLACVYFAHQNYPLSLRYNLEILKRDPQYVEAMSNIGTTLRGMGRHQEAEMWWWQAIQLRPNYWDAVDNLVGVLCSVGPDGRADPARYREALRVCHFVADNVIGRDGRAVVRAAQIPRLQNVLHVAANLHYQLGELDKARREYERVLCVMFGGLSVETVIAQAMHTFGQPPGSLLLLVPEQAVNLVAAIFPGSDGILPGLASGTNLASSGNAGTGQELTPQQIQQSNQVTATVLLTLAKWHQDAASCPPAVLGVVLPLYYLSLSLHQSPSTCNNLGILLSGIQQTVTDPTTNTVLSGPQLAMRYYTYGLKLDARHAHLYTNLGSLLKDAGQLEQAIQMYERAVCFNPKFDVALANLANAVKDAGRVQDSIQWYRRAVEVNPDFAEAVCGLVNALGGVCDWRGRGGVAVGWSKEPGWMEKVIEIVDKQLNESRSWAAKVLSSNDGRRFLNELCEAWTGGEQDASAVPAWLAAGAMAAEGNGALPCEGGWAIRALEKCLRRIQHRWYLDQYGDPERGVPPRRPNEATAKAAQLYRRPVLPLMAAPPVPTVLPFHTFTYPLSPRQVRLISHRNALRISHNALTANWLPPVVYRPPPPPSPKLRIGYVSSDFNNHPLAHLMQSVFGFHDRNRCVVFCYAITPSDNSPYRAKIEREADVFLDVSSWTTKAIVEQIVNDGIHILVNLNGYTKGARNEIFAARPCPVQVSYMGFAGTLAAGWCDYFIVDPIVCPPDTVACERWRQRPLDHNTRRPVHRPGDCGPDLDPEDETELDWVYSERLIYMPHSYFVNDHRQGFREKDEDIKRIRTLTPEQRWLHEEDRRWKMRREVFPGLDDNVVIFANFNQLYKIDPNIFRVWLRILTRVPNSILWLLRFPAAGEQHILRTAKEECGEEVASRIVFTDVAAKHIHIHRGRVADLFLDTTECNGHTTAADILWSGTPVLTYPRHRHKMCSRVAASIAYATGYGDEMTVYSEQEYEDRAVRYALDTSWEYVTDPTPTPYQNTAATTEPDQPMPPSNARIPAKLQASHLPPITPGLHRRGRGSLINLRMRLFLTRDVSPLFDTPRWTRNLEKGYWEAWRRWASGEDLDDDSQLRHNTGCIYITDDDDAAAALQASGAATNTTATSVHSNTLTHPQHHPPTLPLASPTFIRGAVQT